MQNVKGTYDYFGKEQALRRQIQTTLRQKFELYDYDEMVTTELTELEFLTSKYAGGDEIVKEMYQLTDQRRRSLGLRYDLTIPFAKVIALNPGLELPFKRYEMGKVFRDGPVKRGRLREFLQCDVDVVGVKGPEAEVELMQLAVDVFRTLDIEIALKWNNRRFLGEVLAAIEVRAEDTLSVMLTLDKLAKVGLSGVKQELIGKGLGDTVINGIMALIELKEPSLELLMNNYGLQNSEGALEVLAVRNMLLKLGLERVCVFEPFLSRGLSFYTGTVYEIFDAASNFASSLGGGGRYDAIIGELVGRNDSDYSAAGLSFGMESIMALLETRAVEKSSAAIVLIPLGVTAVEMLQTAAELRAAGLRVRLDTSGRKLKNILASVSDSGIRYALLLGESEWKEGLVRLKDMEERTEQNLCIDEVIYRLADR
ncbi:histidine--tRNA ligase [Paenibacillus sp. FSL H8-0548]|uniref:histidine--tRNA ligase n=1 Tax=Paenibacillus sp. FSL H8-0548 TaxID=1920422 RepID=UPI00096F5124|nr:histidine--tRNA ligase [Paenibacillus sp. FSL H8-0548]OMF19299.1 histidine--tRNA ligase [Paenibacillus sp. FSL H8-0548]